MAEDLFQTHFSQAVTLQHQQMYTQAISLYRQLLYLRPDCHSAAQNLGLCLIQSQHAQQALIYWQSFLLTHQSAIIQNYVQQFFMLEIKPKTYEQKYNRALNLRKQGTTPVSLKMFMTLGSDPLCPTYIRVLSISNIILLYQHSGHINKAINSCKSILSIAPPYIALQIKNKLTSLLKKQNRYVSVNNHRNLSVNNQKSSLGRADIFLLSAVLTTQQKPMSSPKFMPLKNKIQVIKQERQTSLKEFEINFIKPQPTESQVLVEPNPKSWKRRCVTRHTTSINLTTYSERRQLRQVEDKYSMKKIEVILEGVTNAQEKGNLMAGCLLAEKDPQRALTHLKLGYKITDDKEKYCIPIADCLNKLGRLKQLEHFYFMMVDSTKAQSYRRLGWLQINRGKLSDGIDNLEKASSIDLTNRKINQQLSEAYLMLSSPDSLETAIHKLSGLKDQTAEEMFLLARCFFSAGHYTQCQRLLLKALHTSTNSPEIYYYLGKLAQVKQQFEQASQYYLKALSIDNKFTLAANQISSMLLAMGHLEDAQMQIQQVLTHDSHNPDSCRLMVLLGQKIQDKQIQKEFLKRLLKANDEDVVALYKLAVISNDQGNLTSCKSYLKRCLALENTHYQAWLLLGKCELIAASKQVHVEQALKIFRQLQDFEQNDKQMNHLNQNIAKCLHLLEYSQEALSVLANCESQSAKILKVEILIKIGKGPEALPLYERELINCPNQVLQLEVSREYQNQGRLEEAYQSLRNCLSIDPEYVPAILTLGFYYLLSGKQEMGLQTIEKAFEKEEPSMERVSRVAMNCLQLAGGQAYLVRLAKFLQKMGYQSKLYRDWLNRDNSS